MKHSRSARIKNCHVLLCFCSYLGFGLKAARLATLGALNTEGMSR